VGVNLPAAHGGNPNLNMRNMRNLKGTLQLSQNFIDNLYY